SDLDRGVDRAAGAPDRPDGKAGPSGGESSRDDAPPAQQRLVDRWDQRTTDTGRDQTEDGLSGARRDDPRRRGAALGQGPALKLVMDGARVVGHERLARQLTQRDPRPPRQLAARRNDQERA